MEPDCLISAIRLSDRHNSTSTSIMMTDFGIYCAGRRVYDCGSMTYGPGDDPRHPSTGIDIDYEPRRRWGDDNEDDSDWRMI